MNDFIVIKYINNKYMESYLLFTISNKVVRTYFLFMGGGLGYKSFDFKEGWLIMPNIINLMFIMNNLFFPLKLALKNLDKNVCFLDIDDKYDNIRISCDWCSICNGILHTAKQNIIRNKKLLTMIDCKKLKNMDKHLNLILANRKNKLTKKYIEKWCKKSFGKITADYLLLSKIYLKFEIIELRWCPFKRSHRFYYKNKDKRYLEPSEQIIFELGKILTEHETVSCNNCPKIINKNWKYTKSNKKSIFKPLLDYMMKEINKK